MTIEELEIAHIDKCYGNAKYDQHIKISIEFAISVLEELNETLDSAEGDETWWYTDKVDTKIQELKKHLE